MPAHRRNLSLLLTASLPGRLARTAVRPASSAPPTGRLSTACLWGGSARLLLLFAAITPAEPSASFPPPSAPAREANRGRGAERGASCLAPGAGPFWRPRRHHPQQPRPGRKEGRKGGGQWAGPELPLPVQAPPLRGRASSSPRSSSSQCPDPEQEVSE